MFVDRLAIAGIHWTARTVVSLFDTRAPRSKRGAERARRPADPEIRRRRDPTPEARQQLGQPRSTRESLEIASPQREQLAEEDSSGATAETLNIRAPDQDLLETIGERPGEPFEPGGER